MKYRKSDYNRLALIELNDYSFELQSKADEE